MVRTSMYKTYHTVCDQAKYPAECSLGACLPDNPIDLPFTECVANHETFSCECRKSSSLVPVSCAQASYPSECPLGRCNVEVEDPLDQHLTGCVANRNTGACECRRAGMCMQTVN